ncbi:Ankyrin repeat family A protein 2 [Operophtera brumata]|uniref:Ankyrin repeat family A protein 2 n=1 Tax=Operophtera brumata TaxID=104452 RepID=A0A0L7LGP2_OPEBR|nr:Ankyrin repeat family A protein 2 [Operophtera brumata]
MERANYIKNLIMFKRAKDLVEVLNSGWDPNSEGGWPIRLAARYGCCYIVETLIQHGANPHLVSESGASTLQLAVFSGEHWEHDRWAFLLSCCDSSQLADGAAVAIIFNITAALIRILETGRCNAHIPTTLTGNEKRSNSSTNA